MMAGEDACVENEACVYGEDTWRWWRLALASDCQREVAKGDEEDYKLSAQVDVLSSQQSR